MSTESLARLVPGLMVRYRFKHGLDFIPFPEDPNRTPGDRVASTVRVGPGDTLLVVAVLRDDDLLVTRGVFFLEHCVAVSSEA